MFMTSSLRLLWSSQKVHLPHSMVDHFGMLVS